MNAPRNLPSLTVGLLVAGWPLVALSAPWDILLSSRRVDADPQKSYVVTEQNGPWMIMACSFSGPNAHQQARDLVLELRKRYKLPAYMYQKKFDFGKDLYGRGVDEFGNPKRMQFARGKSEIEEIAVLVGDYPSVDDPEAQETLRRLKYYQPECLKIEAGKPTARSLAGLRLIQASWLAPGNERRHRGPMGHAFVTTNPLLPSDYFAPKGIDELVLKANEGVEHCLLDCPGKYTVQVATFTGQVVIKPAEIAAIQRGKPVDSKLAEAALKAHQLTEALRIKGYEAYEFHDRYASIVTVGSFDSIGRPRPDGVIELDPRIQAIIDRFKADPAPTGQHPAGGVVARQILGIPLDPQPRLVHVPKRPASTLIRQQNVQVNRLP
ncbi:MAG: hypothetical protein ACUVUC_06970 [Thermoguttaceae bacterium]